MPGTEHTTVPVKDFCGLSHANRQRNKVSSEQQTRVSLWTTGGRVSVEVGHSTVASPDAIIDMGRREAGVDPGEFLRGEIA